MSARIDKKGSTMHRFRSHRPAWLGAAVALPLVLIVAAALAAVAPPGASAAAAPEVSVPAFGSSFAPAFAPTLGSDLRALQAVQQAQLTAADGDVSDCFGHSVAISGDTAVVGAWFDTVGANEHQGSAYVFVRSGTTWSQQAQLSAADGAVEDCFGWSVAISGDTAVVGASGDDVGANELQGSAYVFVRSGTTWSQQAKLTASDGAEYERFGTSVAVSGDSAVVGVPEDTVGDNYEQGSAYIFVRSGTTWSEQQKLTAADGDELDSFGYSVAIEGDTAVAGGWVHAYVFTRSGTTWSEQAQLTPADGPAVDFFGWSVAISGDTAVVGARGDDIGANAEQGSAYVFARSGTTWSQQAKVTADDGAASDRFGWSVAVSGDTAMVGAFNDDVPSDTTYGVDQGSAYVFERSGTTWSQRQKVTSVDGETGDEFGYSIAMSGDTAIVGAPEDSVGPNIGQGAAYVFTFGPAPPGKPVARSPKGLISSRTPTFRWRAAAGAATYQVRVYKGARLIRKKTGITKLSWQCTRRLPRGVYLTWKVRAVNEIGAGPWSTRLRFKVR